MDHLRHDHGPALGTAASGPAETLYTCPMHPEVRQLKEPRASCSTNSLEASPARKDGTKAG